MKKYILVHISLLLLMSCKNETIVPPTNLLIGKIKTLIEYTGNSDTNNNMLFRYHFIYDSLSGLLNKVELSVKNNGVYYNNGTTYMLSPVNNNKIIFTWFEDGQKYKLYHIYIDNYKQITSISETDTFGNNEIQTTFLFRVNNKIDSIFDIGYGGSFVASGTYISKATYNNNNCKSFRLQHSTYFPTISNIDTTIQFYYSSNNNSNMLPYQLPDANVGSSILRLLSYYLNINGYQAFNPNTNLLDSMKISDVIHRYYYEFNNNTVSKAWYIVARDNGSSYTTYNIFEYY